MFFSLVFQSFVYTHWHRIQFNVWFKFVIPAAQSSLLFCSQTQKNNVAAFSPVASKPLVKPRLEFHICGNFTFLFINIHP